MFAGVFLWNFVAGTGGRPLFLSARIASAAASSRSCLSRRLADRPHNVFNIVFREKLLEALFNRFHDVLPFFLGSDFDGFDADGPKQSPKTFRRIGMPVEDGPFLYGFVGLHGRLAERFERHLSDDLPSDRPSGQRTVRPLLFSSERVALPHRPRDTVVFT